ncbi:BT_3928 family protein [Saccharicrinis sp. FJH54]|uniref:BT_3928 family protein n=1 Tax=Saccharicrinis sp. FJH54 TaxID=3344665 RepID=UPI0035D47A57
MIYRRITDLIFRIIVGLVFVFSGFVKAVDPLGSAYKFIDYFEAFNVDFLNPLATALAFIIPALEFAIGFALLFNILKKFTTWVLGGFILYFTGLTLISAITNPVTDCGCFGDAIKLDNWTTFYKNLILLLLSVFLVLNNEHFSNQYFKVRTQRLLWVYFILFSLGISTYSLVTLPIIDFRPYKLGVNIYNSMTKPEWAPDDVYKTTLYYRKDGKVVGFSEDDYPWQDSTWQFVDAENELVSKGYEPPIKSFNVLNSEGEDIGPDIILNNDYQFMIICRDFRSVREKDLEKIRLAYELGKEKSYTVFVISSATAVENQKFTYMLGSDIPIYQADDVLLKSMIRANPGIFVLKEGTIVGKFNLKRTEINAGFFNVLEYTLSKQRMVNNRYNVLTLGLIFFIIILVYTNLDRKY